MIHSQDNSSQHLPPDRGNIKPDATPTPDYRPHPPADPLPNPEPAAPSLDQPDPGVFRHIPAKPPPQ
jgi:hypothetical protein